MEHGMTGPPPALERAVLWLVPAPVREEMAGDLAERYRSPLGYLADLGMALPWVVSSQLRRGTDWTLFLLIAFTLVASLGGLEPDRGQAGPPISLRALVAALPCLAILLLRNAYRRDETWSGARAAGDVAWLAIALTLSQAIIGLVAPSWGLPLGWLIGGFLFNGIVMALLRSGTELANTGLRPGVAVVPDPAEDFRRFRHNLRLRALIETGALAVPALVAAWFGLTANHPVVSFVAGAWAAVTVILIARRWLRDEVPAPADALPARQVLAQYIAELERQRAASGLAWWWYFVPLFAGIGFSTIAFGVIAQRPLAAALGVVACAVLAALIVKAGARRRERLAEKIAQLERGLQA
jgi:hypothetical protein